MLPRELVSTLLYRKQRNKNEPEFFREGDEEHHVRVSKNIPPGNGESDGLPPQHDTCLRLPPQDLCAAEQTLVL